MLRAKKFSDDDFDRIAVRALQMELDLFDRYLDEPEYTFHEEFTRKMDRLRSDVRQGMVRAAEYSMGVTFYLKRCIAAVLLIFTLACITMPETVLAAYHKIIEVVETVFDDYTEYRYRVNDDGGIEETFRPIKLNYLPEGMEEVRKRERWNSIDSLYMDAEEHYLNIYQKEIIKSNGSVYTFNDEDTNKESLRIDRGYIHLVYESDEIRFVGLCDGYKFVGTTNLSKQELIKILEQIEY